jgi:hypothetical protein
MKNAGSCTRYPWLFDTGTEVMGRCEHSISKNFLASGIEDSYFAFNHYFDSSVESGAKPITYIRREGSEENLYIFEKGESIRLKVSEWLDIAEIKLDKPFNEQKGEWDITGFEGAGEDSQNYPYVRTSGVRLNIKVKYHNFNLDKEFKVKIGNDDVYAVITVSPKIGWFSKGDEILYSQDFYTTDSFETNNPVILYNGQPNGIYYDFYRYGILFDIQQTGLVGEVDYVFILIQLTSGVVMLGIATTLVSFIAKFALGNKSEIYRGVIQEEYEVGREAARYAAQACVATKSFKDADEDGKGDLDFDELRALIKESFSKNYLDEGNDTHFTEDEITGMAYYLMRAADDHLNDRILDKREKTPDELRHSKISLHEWQELSTNGVFKFKNLKATSTEHIKNTGWKKDSLKKRKSVRHLKNSNEV